MAVLEEAHYEKQKGKTVNEQLTMQIGNQKASAGAL